MPMILSGCKSITNDNRQVQLCEKTILDYLVLRDRGPAIQYGNLFTETATFSVPKLNISLRSRADIVTRVETAQEKSNTIHMITSMKVEKIHNNYLKAHSHFILYLTPKEAPLNVKLFNGRYVDELTILDNQCYISSRLVLIDRMGKL